MKIYKLQNKITKKEGFYVFKEKNFYKINNDIYNSNISFSKTPIKISLYKKVLPFNPSKVICLAINYDGITGFKKNMFYL